MHATRRGDLLRYRRVSAGWYQVEGHTIHCRGRGAWQITDPAGGRVWFVESFTAALEDVAERIGLS